jgi:hypothetical protein
MPDTLKPATPLPWMRDTRTGAVVIQAETGHDVCVCSSKRPTSTDNTTFIVAACNAYPHLTARVKRLEEALEKIARPEIAWNHVDGLQLIARAALNQTKGD